MSGEFQFTDYEHFFAHLGEHIVELHFYESTRRISVEELYQHFADRLSEELVNQDAA